MIEHEFEVIFATRDREVECGGRYDLAIAIMLDDRYSVVVVIYLILHGISQVTGIVIVIRDAHVVSLVVTFDEHCLADVEDGS